MISAPCPMHLLGHPKLPPQAVGADLLSVIMNSFRNCTFLGVFLMLLLSSPADEVPCATFQDRSYSCFPRNKQDTPPSVTRHKAIESDALELIEPIIIYRQYPTDVPNDCELIGSIDVRADLSSKLEGGYALSTSQFAEYLGANLIVFQKPKTSRWSKIYTCAHLD